MHYFENYATEALETILLDISLAEGVIDTTGLLNDELTEIKDRVKSILAKRKETYLVNDREVERDGAEDKSFAFMTL